MLVMRGSERGNRGVGPGLNPAPPLGAKFTIDIALDAIDPKRIARVDFEP